MDPFSLTVGAFGATSFALSGIRSLEKVIYDFAKANETVQEFRTHLRDISQPLRMLQALCADDRVISASATRQLDEAGLSAAVNRCGDACNELAIDLATWTRHSSSRRLTLGDQITVAFQKRRKLAELKEKIQHCQTAVEFALQTAQL